MSNLSQNPPQGIQPQIDWCIAWIYQLRGRLGTSGGGGGGSQPLNQVVVGTGSGVTSYNNFIFNDIGKNFIVIGTSDGASTPTYGTMISLDGLSHSYVIGDDDGVYSGTAWYINELSPTTFKAGLTTNFSDYFTLSESLAQIGDVDNNISNTYLTEDYVNKVAIQTNAIATPTMQISNPSDGDTITINNGVRGIYVDPAIPLGSLNIIMPAAPTDGQEVVIWFGGTITTGAIVTNILIEPNAGQTLVQTLFIPAAGNCISGKYRAGTSQWYLAGSN